MVTYLGLFIRFRFLESKFWYYNLLYVYRNIEQMKNFFFMKSQSNCWRWEMILLSRWILYMIALCLKNVLSMGNLIYQVVYKFLFMILYAIAFLFQLLNFCWRSFFYAESLGFDRFLQVSQLIKFFSRYCLPPLIETIFDSETI